MKKTKDTSNRKRSSNGNICKTPAHSSSVRLCNFYIDAFNLYHSIVSIERENKKGRLSEPLNYNSNLLKWCDIRKLCNHFLRNFANTDIGEIFFLTASPHHRPDDQQCRHKLYCQILKSKLGINVIEGKFSYKKEKQTDAESEFIRTEEKQTDVNIAVQIMCDVLLDKVKDVAIVSNDSDMVPIIRAIRLHRPKTNLSVITPPSNEYTEKGKTRETAFLSSDIKTEMDLYYPNRFNRISQIKTEWMLDYQLDDEFQDKEGNIYKNPYKPELHTENCLCFLCKKTNHKFL